MSYVAIGKNKAERVLAREPYARFDSAKYKALHFFTGERLVGDPLWRDTRAEMQQRTQEMWDDMAFDERTEEMEARERRGY